ncbi:MAG: hypothetical protein H0W07_09310, partial [Chloroflexi bacterium]|nr:hypothetical protein [Chloroflexota bacterium]
MADRGGGRWDVGREWTGSEPDPDLPPMPGDQSGSYPPGAYPPSGLTTPTIAPVPPYGGTSSSGTYQPGPRYPPGAYPPGAYPPGAYPPAAYPPAAYPPGAYPPAAYPPSAYPPSAYLPGAYPDPSQAPVRHAPYRDLRAGVPTIDDELPSGGLIRPSRVVLLAALAVSAVWAVRPRVPERRPEPVPGPA